MKKILALLFCLPLLLFAQKKKPVTTKKPTVQILVPQKPANGYIIKGTLKGYADGTEVNLINANSGEPEGASKIKGGKFFFTGTVPNPDFKIIAVNMQPPYITLYMDNSEISINAAKDKFEQAEISGSTAHNDFKKFNTVFKPFESIVSGQTAADEQTVAAGSAILTDFILQNKEAYISALAVYRNFQLTGDEALLENQYNSLAFNVKAAPVGAFIANQVAENSKHPIGKLFADFTQADTLGNLVSLSSLRGKFVLVDFWASWCRPCRQENPNVVNAYNRFKDKNFTVLGVSLDQAKPAWLDAIKMDNLAWTQLSDLKGWGNEVAGKYDVKSIPQNFLIDPNGILVGKNLRGAALDNKLKKLLQ